MKTTAFVACLLLAFGAPSHAQDANALLRKMLATYRGLNSYTHRISSTIEARVGPRATLRGADAELRFQRPNKLYVSVKSPSVGTFVIGSDGRELTIYRGDINTYQKRPSPATAKAAVDSLAEFGIQSFLDPLFFLKGEPAEKFFAGATSKGTSRVFGVNCQVVAVQLTPGSMKGVKSGAITYYIDPSSGLARKILIKLQSQPIRGVARGTKNGKPTSVPVTVSVTSIVTENVQEAQANPALNAGSFTVAIPKGAKLQEVNKPLTGRR
jgi:outer membrane lipoprotein-sorting protein